MENIANVVEMALSAERHIAQQLMEMKKALEAGEEAKALQLARELTKAGGAQRAA